MLLPETLPGWDTRPPVRAGRMRPPWAALTDAVAELMDGIWCGKQRLFVRHFVFQAGARRPTLVPWWPALLHECEFRRDLDDLVPPDTMT